MVETAISASLSELETDLPAYVRAIVGELLVVFDFYAVDDFMLDELAKAFMAGQVR